MLYFDWGDRMNTGERIKTARKQAGLTQKELGKALGVSFQAVAQWETGRRVPKVETIQRIGKALGVSWLWLANPDLTPETFEEAKKGYNDFLIEQRAREHVEKIIEACFGPGEKRVRHIPFDECELQEEYVLYPNGGDSLALFDDEMNTIVDVTLNLIRTLIENIASNEENAEKKCADILEWQKQYFQEHPEEIDHSSTLK